MYGQRSSLTRGSKVWLIWLCLVVFATTCVAESAHFHPNSGPSEQHCSLCIAAHSVARPVQAAIPIAAPSLCVGVLIIGTALVPDSRSTLSIYIRPPPSV